MKFKIQFRTTQDGPWLDTNLPLADTIEDAAEAAGNWAKGYRFHADHYLEIKVTEVQP